jgi:NADH-quinone oxidoreductase subunit J
VIFYAFAIVTVVSAFLVVFSRNIVHAAFSLLFTLFGVAGLYAMLAADFLAVTQVVVYIGGVLVLVLFTVMMTRIPKGEVRRRGLDRYVPAGIFTFALFALLYKVITGTEWPIRAPGAAEATTAEIGTNFMTSYIFPFEYVSLLLLVAMIGAAILIRESKQRPEDIEAALAASYSGEEITNEAGGESAATGSTAAASRSEAAAEAGSAAEGPADSQGTASEEEQS